MYAKKPQTSLGISPDKNGTSMDSSLLIIRTNKIGSREEEMLQIYRQHFKQNIVFALDNRKHNVDGSREDIVSVNEGVLTNLGMTCPDDWGWRCGDFFLYAVHAAYPDFDSYWMIEPDVAFHKTDPGDFFNRCAEDKSDLLAFSIGTREKPWKHLDAAKKVYDEVYGCVFPLIRVSKPALNYLKSERARYGREWDQKSDYSNDEGFVASAIAADPSLSMKRMQNLVPDLFSQKAFNTRNAYTFASLQARPKGIYHPVLNDKEFWDRATRKVGTESSLDHYSDIFRGHLNSNDNAFFYQRALSILTARHLLSFGKAKGALKYKRNEGDYVYSFIEEKTRDSRHSRAVATDFILSPPINRTKLDLVKMTPYAAQPAKGLISYVDVPYEKFKNEPFMYVSQYENAEIFVTASAGQILSDQIKGRNFKPALIFSMGRCGSTLSANLCKAFDVATFSECEALRGLTSLPDAAIPVAELNTVRAVIGSLCIHAKEDQVAIKMRSQNNASPRHFLEACPESRIIFMTRALRPWAASYVNSFNWSAEQIFENLTHSYDALRYFDSVDRLTEVVRYEDMVADPVGETERMLGISANTRIKDVVTDVMKNDSQKGTLGKKKKPESYVEEVLEDLSKLLDSSGKRENMVQAGLIY